jgi:hypothetical protein
MQFAGHELELTAKQIMVRRGAGTQPTIATAPLLTALLHIVLQYLGLSVHSWGHAHYPTNLCMHMRLYPCVL